MTKNVYVFSLLFLLTMVFTASPALGAINVTANTETTVASLTFNVTADNPNNLYSLQFNNTAGALTVFANGSTDTNGVMTLTDTFNSDTALMDSDGLYTINLVNRDTGTIEESRKFQYGLFYHFYDRFQDGSNINSKHWVTNIAEGPSGVCGASGSGILVENNTQLELRQDGSTVDCATLTTPDFYDGTNVITSVIEFDYETGDDMDSTQGFNFSVLDDTGSGSITTLYHTTVSRESGHIKAVYDHMNDEFQVFVDGTLNNTVTVSLASTDLKYNWRARHGSSGTGKLFLALDDVVAYTENSNLEQEGLVYEQNSGADRKVDWTTRNFTTDGAGSPSDNYRTSDDGSTTNSLTSYTDASDSKFIHPIIQLSASSATDTQMFFLKGEYGEGSSSVEGADGVEISARVLKGDTHVAISNGVTLNNPTGVELIIEGSADTDSGVINLFVEEFTSTDSVESSSKISSQFVRPDTTRQISQGEVKNVSISVPLIDTTNNQKIRLIPSISFDDGTKINGTAINVTVTNDDNFMKLRYPFVDNTVITTNNLRTFVGIDAVEDTKLSYKIDGDTVATQIFDVDANDVDRVITREFTSLSPGKHVLNVKYEHRFGSIGTTDISEEEVIFYVIPGGLQLLEPVNDTTISDTNTPTLKVQIEAPEDGDVKIQLFNSTSKELLQTIDAVALGGVVSTISSETNILADDTYEWNATYESRESDLTVDSVTKQFTISFLDASVTALDPDGIITSDTTPDYAVKIDNNVKGRLEITDNGDTVATRSLGTNDNKVIDLTSSVALATGTHTWNATFIPESGSSVTSNTLTYTIVDSADANATITLNSPDDAQAFATTDVTFNFSIEVTEPLTGTAQLFLDDNVEATFSIPTVQNVTFTHELIGIPFGDHTWYVRFNTNATDQDYISETRKFTVNEVVEITLIEPDDAENINELPIVFTGEINTTANGKIVLIIDDAPAGTKEVSGNVLTTTNVSFSLASLEAGKHTWRFDFIEDVAVGAKATGAVVSSSETREFTLLRGDEVDGVPDDRGLIPVIKRSLSESLGLGETEALATFWLTVTMVVVASAVGASGSGLLGVTIFLGMFLTGGVIGFLPKWVVIIFMLVAGFIFAKMFRDASG